MRITFEIDIRRPEQVAEALDLLTSLAGSPGDEAAEPPASAPPADDRGPEAPTPPSTSPPPAGAPASRIGEAAAEKARAGRRRGQRGRSPQADRILEYIREHPGVSPSTLVAELGISKSTVSNSVKMLARKGKVNVEKKGKRKAYYPGTGEILPADANGAKSAEERKIVDLLIEVGRPLPASEISIRTGIRSDHVPAMCAALHRRRVIAQITPTSDGLPARWQSITHPRTMADR